VSELQVVFDALNAINSDILQMAQELGTKAQAYGRASANAAAAARSAEGEAAASLMRTAYALDAASKHCGKAALALTGASQEGQAYVQREVGGSGNLGIASSGSDTSGAWPGSRFGLAQSPTSNGGVNLLPLSDNAGVMASEVDGESGFTDVVIHGNPYEFGTHDGPAVTPNDLAAIVAATPALAGRPIRLLSCSAGKLDDGGAQQVADRIHQPVMAPTDTVHLVGRPGRVRMVIGPNSFTNSGTWRIFMPSNTGASE
jgi:hypothetical protein